MSAQRVCTFQRMAERLDTDGAYVLALVDAYGLSVEFVAAMTGRTEARTQRLLDRARRRLARRMEVSRG